MTLDAPSLHDESDIVVVIPTYNERDNIEPLVERVLAELPGARVLIVDDNSPDGTGAIADHLQQTRTGHVYVLHRPQKQGLGVAYVAGFTHALQQWPDARYIFQMDADSSHDPAYLKPLVNAAHEADLAVGSRYIQGAGVDNWPLWRLIISRTASTFALLVTGLPITDCTGGYKCFRASTLRAIDLPTIRSNGYCFQIETSFRAWRQGLTLRDVPIVFHERRHGQSKLTLAIALEMFVMVLRLGVQRLYRRRSTSAKA